MKLRTAAVVLFSLFTLAPAGASAQEQRAAVCPTIVVSCPDWDADMTLRFTASVTGGDPSVTPAYKWTVSGGKISSGQGTHEVVVEAEGGRSHKATVEVVGYPAACQAAASCTTNFCGLSLLTRKVDEFGEVEPHEEKRRFGGFAQELRNDPNAQGYVIAYAGRRARRGEGPERGARAVRYLVNGWGLDARRLVVIDGGHREEPAVELYLVSSGGIPPQVAPTVEPSDVEFVKDAKARRARGRRTKGHDRR